VYPGLVATRQNERWLFRALDGGLQAPV